MIPLIPSPGSPKTTSTPQSINPSMSTSAAVMADTFPVNICAQLRCAPSESWQHEFSPFFQVFGFHFESSETLLDPRNISTAAGGRAHLGKRSGVCFELPAREYLGG